MRKVKALFSVLIIVVFVVMVVVSGVQTSQEKIFEKLSHDAYWAVTLYDGWLENECSVSLNDFNNGKERSGDITRRKLVQFYERYDKRAAKLYKKLSETSGVELDSVLIITRYRVALQDVIRTLKKEKLTKQDSEVIADAYFALIKVGGQFYELQK